MSKTKVMVAVDFSDYSPKVVAYAGQLAEKMEAELLFVNVINQRDINMVKKVTRYTERITVEGYLSDAIKDRTEQMRKMIKETNCSNIPNRFVIKKGVPFSKLIETAREEKVDMVVMGTKGRGDLEGILFGSQADKMFRHCPVPLLSIREENFRG
jgi:nucleotide-binding universal stress UspA family protein